MPQTRQHNHGVRRPPRPPDSDSDVHLPQKGQPLSIGWSEERPL